MGILLLLLALLLPVPAHATTWFSCDGNTWCGSSLQEYDFSGYGKPNATIDLVSGQSSPTGSTNVWRILLPEGFMCGQSSGRIWPATNIPGGTQEFWAQWYWKYSPGFYIYTIHKQAYIDPSNTMNMGLIDTIGLSMGPQGPNAAVYWANTGPSVWYVRSSDWHKYKAYYKLNTGSQFNGIYKAWVDDVLVADYSNVYFADGTSEFGGFRIESIPSVCGPDMPNDSATYFAGVYLGDTDPGGDSGTDTSPPYTSGHDPAKSATGIAKADRTIVLHMLDSGVYSTGVNSTNIYVGASINGAAYTYWSCASGLSCTGSSADYTITRTMDGDWTYSDNVSIKVSGSDVQGNWMAEETYVFAIEPDPGPGTLAITTTSLGSATVGTIFSPTLAASGGTSPYAWDNTATLPAGLTVPSSGTGSWGIPTTAGTPNVALRVTDSASATDTKSIALTIAPLIGGSFTVAGTGAIFTKTNSGSPDTNYLGSMEVYQWPAGVVANRIYLQDNTARGLPDNIVITSATLRLRVPSAGGWEGSGGTTLARIHAYNVTDNIPTLSTVTWNNDTSTRTEVSVTEVPLSTGWAEWNILSSAQAAKAGNITMTLAADGANDSAIDTNRIFDAAEIVITYTQLVGPGGPSISAPGKARVTMLRGTMR